MLANVVSMAYTKDIMRHHIEGHSLEAELEQTEDPEERSRLIEEAYKELIGERAVTNVIHFPRHRGQSYTPPEAA